MSAAREYATRAHAGQTYGHGEPYTRHLADVERVLADYRFTSPFWVAGAWLHDVVEDTGRTIDEIADLFGTDIADVVSRVSGFGHNRRARNADIYRKVCNNRRAAILKAADRIANIEASAAAGTDHWKMYIAERVEFAAAVERHLPAPMRIRLRESYTRAALRSGDRAV